ncbi:hypothetical protein [Azospirillum sp.]|uniref:hypothetical protein n=1 Tax=Azospirillum sp. TaxID=34012 RepID=UPI0026378929|nr:hypothetical protein [Azospirillum sp.]
MAENRFTEVLRKITRHDRKANAESCRAVGQAAEVLKEQTAQFCEQEERIKWELNRGTRLTKHKLNL